MLYRWLSSLSLGLWLIGLIVLFLAAGSFTGTAGAGINEVALFDWLRDAPLDLSWWLWLSLCLLALLALNTLLCSIQSIKNKVRSELFLVAVGPQIMHLGFLLIMVAHLYSAYGGMKQAVHLFEGYTLTFEDGSVVIFDRLTAEIGPRGMPLDYSAAISINEQGRVAKKSIRPNQPYFHQGFGLYLKEVRLFPVRAALIEVHREPGAGFALGGSALFVIGSVLLLTQRRGRRNQVV